MPVAAVVFGSVTPPQGDIVDLTVHLGCSTEISSFDCLLQNFDKKYSPGGTYPINVGDNGSISLGRGANCPLLLTLKVEEIEPLSTAIENYIRVRGRCWGEQLFRRVVTKSWDNVKGEVVVKYLIDNYTSLSHIRSSVELIEDTDTTYTRLDFEDTQVFEIIKYIAETSDLAGVIGYDFRIAPDSKFEFFPKNSKTSSVSLAERLEVSEYKKGIFRVRNRIKVYGAEEREYPSDSNQDGLTESITNWVTDGNNGVNLNVNHVTVDNKVQPPRNYSDSYSVRGTHSWPPLKSDLYLGRDIPSANCAGKGGFKQLVFWFYYWQMEMTALTSAKLRLYAPDASNYFEADILDMMPAQLYEWGKIAVAVGKDVGWTKVGSPDWSNIQHVRVLLQWTSNGNLSMNFDHLRFESARWYSMQEVPGTPPAELREKSETDEELHSDAECAFRAKALLDFLKDPIETLKVRSEVIDYGTLPILAGDKVHVVVPNENIDSDYRVISVEYKASGRNQTLEIELELAKEPQLLADFIYGFRKAIQKLDKYKSGR